MKKIANFIAVVSLFCILFSCGLQNKKEDKTVVYVEESNDMISTEEIEEEPIVEYLLINKRDTFPLFSDNEFDIAIKECSLEEYETSRQQYFKGYERTLVIQSVDSIIAELDKINVSFTLGRYESITSINLANGKVINFCDADDNLPADECFSEVGITAYCPEYHLLLMEGGHSLEMGVNVLTGEDILEVGNTSTQLISPNRKFRLSDVYGGQECSTFIFQKIEDGEMTKLFEINDFQILCYYIEVFWTDDYNLYYKIEASEGEYKYYKLVIERK